MQPRIPGHALTTEEDTAPLTRSSSSDSVEAEEPRGDSPTSRQAYGTFRAQANDQPPPQQEQEDEPDEAEIDADAEAISALTRRLRCLFGVVTFPIVPMATLAVLALLWFFYAYLLDFNKTCSHPLKGFALATLSFVFYTPNHNHMRSWLFNYQRERDGPNRPPIVRRYDQIFHTAALLYVYAGITLVQTCREDAHALNEAATDENSNIADGEELVVNTNTCDATCPNLFPALSVYVTTLEVFTFSLILPLLFLPCIYLWFIRQAQVDDEVLNILQERLREEEAILSGVSPARLEEILEQLEPVKLVRRFLSNEEEQLVVVPLDANSLEQSKDAKGARECCICMNEFVFTEEECLIDDVEMGMSPEDDDEIVRTRACGHLFHKRCMAGWVGGRWQRQGRQQDDANWNRRLAKRSTCPLCRSDLRASQS